MRIEKIKYMGVREDGTFVEQAGAVETKGCVRMATGEGCGLESCNCSELYFISIWLPRSKKGIVEGIKVVFDNRKEMVKFAKKHELIG